VEAANITNFKHIVPPRLNDLNPFLYLRLMDQFRWKNPDIVHVKTFAGVIATKAVSAVTKQSTPVVYDAQNFETGKIQKASGGLPWYKSVAAPYLIPALESIAVRIADHVVAVNDEDRKAFEDELSVPEDKLSVVPSGSNIVDRENADVSNFLSRHNLPDNELILIFHGWYGYYPNEEAVRAIIRQVVPKLQDQGFDFEFVVAGRGVPAFDKVPNVTGLGFVDDLDAFLCAADLAVVPLRHGGGTKLKMLDYLSAGVPTVTTEKGAEGIDLKDGESALIFDGVNESFVSGIVGLLNDEELRKEIGTNAHELFQDNHEWKEIIKDVNELYTCLARTLML